MMIRSKRPIKGVRQYCEEYMGILHNDIMPGLLFRRRYLTDDYNSVDKTKIADKLESNLLGIVALTPKILDRFDFDAS